jgi:hypothetical protein
MRYERLWRNKYLTLSATTIDEMAETLEMAASDLRDMARAGIWLDPDGVADDFALLRTDDPVVAREFDFDEEECDADEEDCVQ